MGEILLIAFGTLGLACGVLAVFLIVKHFFNLYMKEDLALKQVALDQNEDMIAVVSNLRQVLRSEPVPEEISEIVDGSTSKLRISGMFHYEQLLDNLFNDENITEVTEYADKLDGYGNRVKILRVQREDKSFFLLEAHVINVSEVRLVKYKLKDIELPAETLAVEALYILTPNKECGEDCRIISYSDLKKVTAEVLLTEVRPERPEQERLVYKLFSDFDTSYFDAETFDANAIPQGILDLSYAPIKIASGGVNYAVPVGKLQPIIENTVAGKKNIVILGPSGVGKTTLITNVIENYKGAVILLDLASLPVFASPMGQAAFKKFAARHDDILIVLDEAQGLTPDQETWLLTLMNNGLSIKSKKTSLLIALNALKSQVSAPLINTNRCHMILELEYLNKARAMNLITELEKDATLKIDQAQFTKIVDGTASQSGAVKLANTISLSDVFHCVNAVQEVDLLKEKLALFKVV